MIYFAVSCNQKFFLLKTALYPTRHPVDCFHRTHVVNTWSSQLVLELSFNATCRKHPACNFLIKVPRMPTYSLGLYTIHHISFKHFFYYNVQQSFIEILVIFNRACDFLVKISNCLWVILVHQISKWKDERSWWRVHITFCHMDPYIQNE